MPIAAPEQWRPHPADEPTRRMPAMTPLEAASRCTPVLVVEDNIINQKVVVAMLDALGIPAIVAENGQCAVELVRAGDFDIVLMDCQMPVMDGYAATVAIRNLPDGRGARLPVIAVTGNAMQSDRLKCQQAGMDDFLAKPFTLADLRAILTRWLPALHCAQTDTATLTANGDDRSMPTQAR
jgi:CheY-like chemotaxis protein